MDLNTLVSQASVLEITHRERNRIKVEKFDKIEQKRKEINDLQKDLELYAQACNIMGTVANSVTRETLDTIRDVINRALLILFPNNHREVQITSRQYKKVYTHFIVELKTETGSVRSFKVSGSGLSQVISFLFLVCLVDARGGRKLIIMDEILNGLHPSAKGIIYDIIMALNKRFQFVIIEYGLDIGKQYMLQNDHGNVTVTALDSTKKYYRDIADHLFDDDTDDITDEV